MISIGIMKTSIKSWISSDYKSNDPHGLLSECHLCTVLAFFELDEMFLYGNQRFTGRVCFLTK